MNFKIENIKKILEIKTKEKDLDIRFMPQEEANLFLTALNQLDKFLIKFDPECLKLSKDELKRWGIIYLLFHDLLHCEVKDNDLIKLELLTTAPIFSDFKEVLNEKNLNNLATAYFVLGFGSLKINHNLSYLISEKIILGEFVSVGGLEHGIWGIKIKSEILPTVASNIYEKIKKDKYLHLVKSYKDFAFDFL